MCRWRMEYVRYVCVFASVNVFVRPRAPSTSAIRRKVLAGVLTTGLDLDFHRMCYMHPQLGISDCHFRSRREQGSFKGSSE